MQLRLDFALEGLRLLAFQWFPQDDAAQLGASVAALSCDLIPDIRVVNLL